MPDEEKKEKKDEDKIVLQVDMHCEGCKDKVRRALKCFPGLEKIEVDMKEQKVTVKGKLDARKVYETVKKKSGKRTILLYPDLKKVDEQKKEEPKKDEPPPDPEITVVLKVNMHCAACAKQIKKSLEKMSGVTEVSVDVGNGIVTVKGRNIDPKKACDRVKRKSGKHCEIVPPPPPPPEEKKEDKKPEKEESKEEKPAEEKKEEEKKEEEKPAEEKKEEEKPAEEKKEEEKPAEEKKEEAPAEEKKEEEKKDEAKKEEKAAEEKKEEAPAAAAAEEEAKVEIKKYEYIPYRSVPEYVYPPQLFSDENPNACSVM